MRNLKKEKEKKTCLADERIILIKREPLDNVKLKHLRNLVNLTSEKK